MRIVERLLAGCGCPWAGKLAIVRLGEVGECVCVRECVEGLRNRKVVQWP